MAVRSALSLFWILVFVTTADARQNEDAIARGIVIGQAYVSGSIVVAGFVEDTARSWPQSITLARLFVAGGQHPSADFVRALTEEHPESFSGGSEIDIEQNVFAAMDHIFHDRPVALYRSRVTIAESTGVFGWDGLMGVRDISHQNRGQLRPTTSRERDEIAAAKRKLPKGIKCTTVPQWLDAAKILLTTRIPSANAAIRLSSFQNPGCLGHLSTTYVLDVMTPGREPRRFEFRHDQGVL
jgi:hypothetical protein